MTFAEYNTDENFNKPSNAMELVRLGKEEGKTREEIANSLSPLWKEDKKGNVKKALDYHFAEEPKEEEKPAEEKVTEKVIEQTTPKEEAPKAKTSTLDTNEKAYIKKQDEIADTALNTTLNDVENRRTYNWEQQYETGKKAGEAFKRIDDKMIEQLPTFMIKRYANGEFGDPKSGDAKLRLAHFMINGVQAKLKNASNAFMSAAGRSPIFADTTSDYEKYQQSNFAKGLENRWRKYEAETENAIQLATKEGIAEQEARLEAEKIANDKKMATKWNMMDARQKVDLMQIKKEIGKLVGNMDLSEIADFMTGEAISGDLSKDEAIVIGVAQLVKISPELLRKLPEGKYKSAILGLFGGGDVESIISSLNGSGGAKEPNPDATLEDGTNIDSGKVMTNADYDKIIAAGEKLGNQYYNGEITEEQFRKEYAKLEAEMKKHNIYNKYKSIMSQDDYLAQIRRNKRVELSEKIDKLNDNAKNYTKDEYLKKYDDLKSQAAEWGASEKDLKSIEKSKEKALKKVKK